jgi:ribosomal protein S18 acetylase RimI-like enzyme
MGITTRDLRPEDADATAALMSRIEADHPTGFCLGPVEVAELMSGASGSVWEGAFDGDRLVAYTTIMPGLPHEEVQRFNLFGDVDPARLGEGLGTLMLGRSLDRARAIHAADAPDSPARYAHQALAGRDDQADLLATAGFSRGRHSFLMVADLHGGIPKLVMPDGLTAGPFDRTRSEELRLAHNAAFADYPDGTPISAEFWGLFMGSAEHNRHHLSVVARDASGAVAGYVFAHEYAVPPSGGPGPEIHIPYVGTLPEHRGRGLAAALLARVLRLSRAEGYDTASLNVDTANPTGALGIYERAGFRTSYRQDSFHLDE